MIDILIVSFFTGVFAKFVDLMEDHGLKAPRLSSTFFGVIYGFLIFYVIFRAEILASLWLGTVVGMILAGKTDAVGHYFGVGILIVLLVIFGFPEFSLLLFLVFIIANLAEEILNNIVDRGSLNRFRSVIKLRPLLEITAFIISIVLWQWIFFFALLCFDLGYLSVKRNLKQAQ